MTSYSDGGKGCVEECCEGNTVRDSLKTRSFSSISGHFSSLFSSLFLALENPKIAENQSNYIKRLP